MRGVIGRWKQIMDLINSPYNYPESVSSRGISTCRTGDREEDAKIALGACKCPQPGDT